VHFLRFSVDQNWTVPSSKQYLLFGINENLNAAKQAVIICWVNNVVQRLVIDADQFGVDSTASKGFIG
jgi:hypothetical protein